MAFLSVRNPLTGQLDDFLKKAGFRDLNLLDGLMVLIEKMKIYREEGRPLSPQIYIVNKKNFENIKKTIPYFSEIPLGKIQNPEIKSFQLILKKAAPLAREGWHIYICLSKGLMEFGLFRSQSPFYSVPIEAIVVDQGTKDLPVILIKQVAESAVQLKCVDKHKLDVHFSTREEYAISWQDHQTFLVNSITRDIHSDYKDMADSFFTRAINDASQYGHGFLAAVIAKNKKVPKELADGTIFTEPISITSKIQSVLKEKSIESYTDLQAALVSISGMLNSDGIILFDSCGVVRGYNIFVPLEGAKGKAIVGGARKRTHEKLKMLVQKNALLSCYYQSQDGECEWVGGKSGRK